MCRSVSMIQLLSLLLVASAAFAAPVENVGEVSKRSADPPVQVQEVVHQDEDLQDLLNLVNKQASQKNVMVHKEKVTHFENNNGDTVRVNTEEEKVVDTNTGNVIADVQQEVKQQATEDQQEPETVVETKVDIPAEGVHETFVQDENEATSGDVNTRGAEGDAVLPSNEDTASSLEPELTPADMAEYLYATQQFDAFYSALDRLVNQSMMTVGDASSYAKAVAVEYERLQLQDLENRLMFEEGPLGQLASSDDVYGMPPQAAPYGLGESFPPAEYQRLMGGYLSPEEQEEEEDFLVRPDIRSYPPTGMQPADLDPYEFLAALWTEAYGKGNEEAQELVRMLYNRVSNDGNPDDMSQIRDILMETVAASVNESPYNFDPEMLDLEIPTQQEGYQVPNLPEDLLSSNLEQQQTAGQTEDMGNGDEQGTDGEIEEEEGDDEEEAENEGQNDSQLAEDEAEDDSQDQGEEDGEKSTEEKANEEGKEEEASEAVEDETEKQ